MSRILLGHLWVIGGCLLVACGTDFTSGGGGGGTTPGTGGTTSGGGNCPADDVPIPPIPEDWSGPAKIAMASSADLLPNCPSGFPTLTLHDDLESAEASCTCSCGELECEATIGYYATNMCSGTPASDEKVPTGCTNVSPSSQAAKWEAVESCKPTTTPDFLEPSWNDNLRVCAIYQDSETDHACAPAPASPFAPSLCITRRGSHDCPEGYPEKTTLFSSWEEGRTCNGECTCATGLAHCSGALEIFQDVACAGPTASVWQSNNCITSLTFASVAYVATTEGGCTASSLGTSGTVTPSELYTICCTP